MTHSHVLIIESHYISINKCLRSVICLGFHEKDRLSSASILDDLHTVCWHWINLLSKMRCRNSAWVDIEFISSNFHSNEEMRYFFVHEFTQKIKIKIKFWIFNIILRLNSDLNFRFFQYPLVHYIYQRPLSRRFFQCRQTMCGPSKIIEAESRHRRQKFKSLIGDIYFFLWPSILRVWKRVSQ